MVWYGYGKRVFWRVFTTRINIDKMEVVIICGANEDLFAINFVFIHTSSGII